MTEPIDPPLDAADDLRAAIEDDESCVDDNGPIAEPLSRGLADAPIAIRNDDYRSAEANVAAFSAAFTTGTTVRDPCGCCRSSQSTRTATRPTSRGRTRRE